MAKAIITIEDTEDGFGFTAHFDTSPHGDECTCICPVITVIAQALEMLGTPVDLEESIVRH